MAKTFMEAIKKHVVEQKKLNFMNLKQINFVILPSQEQTFLSFKTAALRYIKLGPVGEWEPYCYRGDTV